MSVRRYVASSSLKMSLLFSALLGVSLVGLIVLMVVHYKVINQVPDLLAVLWLSVALSCIVIFVSFFISIYVVRRINHIAEVAQNIIDTGDLSQRIELSAKWDDLSALAYLLNDLFARMEQLVTGVRQVSDNIAHDLRTPLTRVRARLEAIHQQLPEGQIREQLNEIVDESDRLLNTFKAMLRISAIENGRQLLSQNKMAFDSLVVDVVELYEPLAEQSGLSFKATIAACQVVGDRDLLFQALANLLDNAIKFTPAGGQIYIDAYAYQGGACFELSDTGKGISHKNKDKVFERFFREDQSRSLQGNGLGLALVKAVVDWHKGRVVLLENSPCGLTVKVFLP